MQDSIVKMKHASYSQVTEIIELERPDSSKVKLLSYSKNFEAPGIARVKWNSREWQNDHSSCKEESKNKQDML